MTSYNLFQNQRHNCLNGIKVLHETIEILVKNTEHWKTCGINLRESSNRKHFKNEKTFLKDKRIDICKIFITTHYEDHKNSEEHKSTRELHDGKIKRKDHSCEKSFWEKLKKQIHSVRHGSNNRNVKRK